MSDAETPEPAAVQEARRRSRNGTIVAIGVSLAVVPMIAAGKALGISPEVATLTYLGLAGVAALFAPWRQYSQDLQTIKEHHRHIAQQALGITREPAAQADASATDPLAALARRVRTLAGDDGAIPGLVDGVLARRADLQRDLSSLEEALALEAAVDGEENPRHARLAAVADARRADLKRLGDALRDLHVELTVRSDADHTATVQRVDHMLASLSAETELAALGGDAGSTAPPAQEAGEAAARARAAQAQRKREV